MTTTTELENRIAELEAELATAREQAHHTDLTRQESQRMLQLVLDTIPIRVFWKDKDLTYLGCNRLFAHDAGLAAPEEIIGKDDFAMWWAEHAEPYRADDRRVIETGEAKISYEQQQPLPDGSRIWLSANKIPLRDSANNVIGVLGAYDDITERKQVEEALQDSEARYSAVINQARDGVILVQDHLCLFVNQALADMLGYTPAEMENTPFVRYLAPESQEVVAGRIKARLEGQDLPALYEARLLRKDGTVIDAELSPNVIQYRGKTAYMDFIRDISERKRLEIEREQLQQEVIEAQKRAIQELSTPIIPVMDRIIVMPLIGSIDTMRARDITRTLLAGIRENRAKIVILDITGVPLVDSGVANHLNKTIQAARLKGARTIITGVSDAVAETIVDLGIDWSGIETLANLQTGLVAALASLGVQLTMRN